jgi:hypothetical protein
MLVQKERLWNEDSSKIYIIKIKINTKPGRMLPPWRCAKDQVR